MLLKRITSRTRSYEVFDNLEHYTLRIKRRFGRVIMMQYPYPLYTERDVDKDLFDTVCGHMEPDGRVHYEVFGDMFGDYVIVDKWMGKNEILDEILKIGG